MPTGMLKHIIFSATFLDWKFTLYHFIENFGWFFFAGKCLLITLMSNASKCEKENMCINNYVIMHVNEAANSCIKHCIVICTKIDLQPSSAVGYYSLACEFCHSVLLIAFVEKLTPRDVVTQVIRFGFQTDFFPWHKCLAYCKHNDSFYALVSLSSFKLRNVTSIQRFKIESTGNFTNKPLHYPMTDFRFFLMEHLKGLHSFNESESYKKLFEL